jgi:hypothetical protein
MTCIKDNPPTALEALRPIVECETAELLRFLNFTTALQNWYSLKYKYDHADTLPVEICYKEERALYVATVSLQDRLYCYDPYDPEGKFYRLDRDFIALFQKVLPPMFDGTVFTWPLLLRELKATRQRIFGHLRNSATPQTTPSEN